MNDAPRLWTIGHSTHSAEEFVAILRAHAIALLADVRSFPSSRRHPHFNRDALRDTLAAAGIEYVHLPALGGRRTPRQDSHNTAWRNAGFRGYADYMETPAFEAALADLIDRARARRTAIMCAESLWWHCHRSLIADGLKVRGWDVVHIHNAEEVTHHPYTRAARVEHGKLCYVAATPSPRG
jgi:uncharacterized protein (DUF488 family)